jgi:sn-glycerol 3-phosphate transport system permease protein
MLSAYAIVYFRFPFRMFAFWMIFITLMLPVEVRILPTYDVVARLGMLNTYPGLIDPADRLGHGHLPLPAVLPDVPDELVEAARIDRRGPIRSSSSTSCCRCRARISRRSSSSSSSMAGTSISGRS